MCDTNACVNKADATLNEIQLSIQKSASAHKSVTLYACLNSLQLELFGIKIKICTFFFLNSFSGLSLRPY